jgi:hypothetical protein
VVAFAVAALTLFSGFGLGSILVATFVVFFPVEVAVSAAAVVHLAYNMLKTALLHRESVPRILVRFGVPAVAASFIGALMLARLAGQSPVFTWQAGGLEAVVTPLKFLMGALIVGFAVFDLVPRLHSVRFGSRWLPVGGALSGFFGGLSGHQGAFRAAFLSPWQWSPRPRSGASWASRPSVRLAVFSSDGVFCGGRPSRWSGSS